MKWIALPFFIGSLLLIGVNAAAVHAQEPPIAVFPDDSEQDAVIVDLSAVRTQLAGEINMDPTEVPPSVALPVPEAARVCGVPAESLTSADGANACEARKTSLVLNMAVRQEAQTSDRVAAD